MPELPEVETIRRQLTPALAGRCVLDARVTRQRAIRAHGTSEEFVGLVRGRWLLEPRRRGKALLIPMGDGNSILIRLGMSGVLSAATPDEPMLPHTHVVLELDHGRELRYSDPRTFGEMAVVAGHNPDAMRELAHYGPEPLSDEFTPETLLEAMSGTRMLVQAVLMDQGRIAGIGKIYADEACFGAGINPQRSAHTLSYDEVVSLHGAIREVLAAAIEARGTSAADSVYRDVHGQTGEFQDKLYVYQRAGQPCRCCGAFIQQRPMQGRRMHFCPQCQR